MHGYVGSVVWNLSFLVLGKVENSVNITGSIDPEK